MENTMMVTLLTMEHESSQPEIRTMPMATAYKLAKDGGFYKAQVIGDFDEVIYEF